VAELLAVKAVNDTCGAIGHTTRGSGHRRVVIAGLGDGGKLDPGKLRLAGSKAARWLMGEKLTTATLWLDGLLAIQNDSAVMEFAFGMLLGAFAFDELKEPEKFPARIRLSVAAGDPSRLGRCKAAIREATLLADAVNFARSVAHRPPNVLNPATLAKTAQQMAREARIKCRVHEAAALRKLGANGILSVGSGAAAGPCLIELEYRGAPRAKNTFVIVGKAVTFDTGGYSIKPAEGMEAMKFDKCGGMAVLGVLKAAADLKMKCNVVGLIAAAENAISDRAYRPSDIIRMMSGKTVEIISTDAEGRMVLGDALWYAQQEHKPTALINLATLTGGVRIALGSAAAGLMSNDDNLAADLEECGRVVHERVWRLPLWEDYRELIKGTDSDIRNSAAKREAHAIVGGMFLKEFVKEETSWAHLDIAAMAYGDNGKSATGKGATGYGVRLLVEYLRRKSG
jgi:leucyl aminopeptidase